MAPGIKILGLCDGGEPNPLANEVTLLQSATTIYTKYPLKILVQNQISVKYASPTLNQLIGLSDGYDPLAATLVAVAPVIYCVWGDPFIDEAATPFIQAAAQAAQIPVEVISAPARLPAILRDLNLSPSGGLQILDATLLSSYHYPPVEPHRPLLITDVYHPDLIPPLKERLLRVYAPNTCLTCLAPEQITEVFLANLAETATYLYLPAQKDKAGLTTFQNTIAHLRAPNGCPWDQEQTHQSLRPYLLEETYEVLVALDEGDTAALADELGDLLLQIALHAQIASDDGEFIFSDIIQGINAKIIRRHPHVFGDVMVDDAEGVKATWAVVKAQEKAAKGEKPAESSVLDGVQKGLPALAQALEISQKAVRVGFEWESIDGVLEKLIEEAHEITAATTHPELEAEIGDFLFTAVNLARKHKVDPESALRACNARFTRRFQMLEALAREAGLHLPELDTATWLTLWGRAKEMVG